MCARASRVWWFHIFSFALRALRWWSLLVEKPIQEGTSKHRSCAFFSFPSFRCCRQSQLERLRAEVYVALFLPHPQIESGPAVRLDIHRREGASVSRNVLDILIPFYAAFLIMVTLSISSAIQLNTFVPILETSPEAEVTRRSNTQSMRPRSIESP